MIGDLAIFDDRPMHDPRGMSILRIFRLARCAEIEREHTARALRENEGVFRDLYEEAPVAYLSVGVEGCIRQANRAAVELLGYRARGADRQARVRSRAPTRRSASRRQSAAYERFSPAFRPTTRRSSCATTAAVRSGCGWSVLAMRDEAGNVVATRSTLFDCTERKAAENALRESEDRLARILHSEKAAVGTLLPRMEGGSTGSMKRPRSSAARGQALGGPFDDFLADTPSGTPQRARGAPADRRRQGGARGGARRPVVSTARRCGFASPRAGGAAAPWITPLQIA